MKQLTEEQFDELYKPQINHILWAKYEGIYNAEDITSFSGCMYETFGSELDYVRSMIKEGRVATIVEGDTDKLDDDGCPVSGMYIESGYHIVNRMGYLILDKPYEEEFIVTLD